LTMVQNGWNDLISLSGIIEGSCADSCRS
jgi:hypothetical protein